MRNENKQKNEQLNSYSQCVYCMTESWNKVFVSENFHFYNYLCRKSFFFHSTSIHLKFVRISRPNKSIIDCLFCYLWWCSVFRILPASFAYHQKSWIVDVFCFSLLSCTWKLNFLRTFLQLNCRNFNNDFKLNQCFFFEFPFILPINTHTHTYSS